MDCLNKVFLITATKNEAAILRWFSFLVPRAYKSVDDIKGGAINLPMVVVANNAVDVATINRLVDAEIVQVAVGKRKIPEVDRYYDITCSTKFVTFLNLERMWRAEKKGVADVGSTIRVPL